MLQTMPPDMREAAERMHEQHRPMMKRMISNMGDMDMGGMMGR